MLRNAQSVVRRWQNEARAAVTKPARAAWRRFVGCVTQLPEAERLSLIHSLFDEAYGRQLRDALAHS